ncbi:cilia- and flagella-associated protein 221 isoform X1 [Ictalurus punctatus]|uniref:Cilia- and flagella-associated protein 221 isoform X1 n=1 Tax=Ictalurus punctatus TaxID=7998 RepID=A0A979ECF6_ICTPU|nr:cilia- and flagella-associated protein 221 isoform X1 [Ictalurus punctatus]XP_047007214.1 cilia- and flagella-associated protein 221 isoform X1 [Ictalurus punctatus]XP_047007215.1 cilia- and flagella-associated protein 221 isoform X1 [Ictalurus punctatus]
MEVVLQTPNTFSENVKKKKILPLRQLVEETTKTSKVSHHLLETRSFTKVKSNNVVEAEPSELHFSGFEVGKDYKKVVKLINISPEVIHVHILPTQTKYFRTEYTQKSRLIPGLAHTINVHFSPNEWRYFFDSIRIHCKGEENLLVPIHAYPVIDDLNIPSYIKLFPVPLGHSSTYVIPLSCSCPVDFEFQVHCLKSHEAFGIYPLSGIIPAKGKTDLSVTFTPQQYGTAEITLQLVISQFNSKPFICTLTASCSPNLTLNQQRENEEIAKTAKDLQTEDAVYLVAPKLKTKVTSRIKMHTKKKIKSDPYKQSSDVDISNHANLAKMLIQHQDKMSYKDLRKALPHTKTAYQTRQMREAAFENQVQVNAQKDRANHLQWQVQLGDDLFSAEQKIKILKEQEVAAAEYMMNKDKGGREMDIAQIFPKLSSHRVVRCAGQHPDCSPVFYIYGSSQLEVRWRVLRLFQQTVRKVILQVRMNKRLLLLQELQELASSTKRQVTGEKNKGIYEKKQLLNLSSEKLLPFRSPIFPSTNHPDELAINKIGNVHVGLMEEDLTCTIPFFNLKVPQHYKLMGYREVTVYDSKASFAHKKQCRLLRTGAQKEQQEEERPEPDYNPVFFFRTPHNVLNPQNAHPLRIFNPAPSVCAFKPTPSYLESDPEFHLCPLTRQTICKDNVVEVHTNKTQKKFLDREDIIKGTIIWKKFPCLALNAFSSLPAQASNQSPRMCDPFSSLVLPLEAPPSLKDLSDNIKEEILLH